MWKSKGKRKTTERENELQGKEAQNKIRKYKKRSPKQNSKPKDDMDDC